MKQQLFYNTGCSGKEFSAHGSLSSDQDREKLDVPERWESSAQWLSCQVEVFLFLSGGQAQIGRI